MAFDPRKLGIVDMSDPTFVYGRSATAKAAPFRGMIVHHTADKPIENLVNYGKTVDAARGGAFGYHFYIGKDGRIIQGAPLDKRTNHIKPPGHSARKGGGDLSNANAIGISLVGAEKGATPEQRAAAEKLGRALMTEYGISPEFIFGHGEIQGDRQHTEGADLVGILRGGNTGDPNVVRVADATSDAGSGSAYFRENFLTEKKVPPSEAKASGGSTYFRENFLKEEAKTAGEPAVSTDAPVAPAGLDAPPPPNWWQRQAEGVDKAIFGDAEFKVPELKDSTMILSPFYRPKLAEGIKGMIRQNAGPVDVERAYGDFMTGLMVADNEAAMGEMVKKYLGVEPIADANGNLYVDVDGERFALDKSGLSPRDIDETVLALGRGLATVGAGAGLGGGIGSVIGMGLKTPLRLAGAAAGGMADQYTEQAISNYYGGNQGMDMNRVLLGGAFALGGEALGMALEKIGPKVMTAITSAKRTANTLDEFKRNLQDLGFDPDEVQRIIRSGLKGTEAEDMGADALARIADAKALPEPVNLTAGQATRDMGLWREEDLARNTGLGDEALRGDALALSREQQRALHKNAAHLFGEWKDAGSTDARGAAIQGVLVGKRAADWGKVSAAYDAARAAGDVRVAVDPVKAMIGDLRKAVRAKATPSTMTVTREMLNELDSIINQPGVKAISLDALEQWRSKATGLINGVSDGGDRVGLRMLVRAYDDAANSSLKGAVVKGDPNALGKWRLAVSERRNFGQKWESEDVLDVITRTRGMGEGAGELKVSPEDVMSAFLGKSTFGGKKDVIQSVQKLKGILGADSEAFMQVKSEALKQLIGSAPTTDVALRSAESVSTKLVANLDKAKASHKALWETLFTSSERNMIERLSRTIDLVNNPPAVGGTMNRSGTGYTNVTAAQTALRKAETMIDRMARSGPGGAIIASFFKDKIRNAADIARREAVRRSLGGMSPPPPIPPALPGVGGAVGAETGEDVFGRPGFLR